MATRAGVQAQRLATLLQGKGRRVRWRLQRMQACLSMTRPRAAMLGCLIPDARASSGASMRMRWGHLQALMLRGEAELGEPWARQLALGLGLAFLGRQGAVEATLEVLLFAPCCVCPACWVSGTFCP